MLTLFKKSMKREHYFLFLLSYSSLAIVSSLHHINFQRTKAEDIDDSYSGDSLNAPPSCDMTSQFCDINCCNDQDCSDQEKRSFECSNKQHINKSKFSYLHCENLGKLESLGNPLLCLHDENSPYLGDFYEKYENFTSFSFSEILAARNKGISGFRITDISGTIYKSKFKHGSNILFLDNEGLHHSINVPSNVLSKGNGYCSKTPLRFQIDETSTCFFLLDEDQCMLNEELHLQHHVNTLKKLELLGDINDVNISYNVVCLTDETGFVTFNKNVFHSITKRNKKYYDSKECDNYAITEVNENKTICKNVVVGFNYTVFVNGTALKSLNVTILTVNIPLNVKIDNFLHNGVLNPLRAPKKNKMHMLQKIYIKFEDTIFRDNAQKHGYILGKPLYLRRS